jgi:hypothetical protein
VVESDTAASAALADGLTIRQSCLGAGIGGQTLRDWQERYPDLEPRLAEAREQARQNALACIKAAGEAGDWRAAEAFLRLSFHQDYRRDSNISLSATANVGPALVCDEPTRLHLIKLNEKILKEGKTAEPPATMALPILNGIDSQLHELPTR